MKTPESAITASIAFQLVELLMGALQSQTGKYEGISVAESLGDISDALLHLGNGTADTPHSRAALEGHAMYIGDTLSEGIQTAGSSIESGLSEVSSSLDRIADALFLLAGKSEEPAS